MLDTLVLLTPLLVLAIAFLLGFAGCGFTGAGSPELLGVARVPQELTVTRIEFSWTDPDNDMSTFSQEDPQPSRVEEGNKVFLLLLASNPASGVWIVRCTIRVRDNGATAESAAESTFPLDEGTTDARTTFQASGAPADLTFAVSWVGLS